MGVVETVGFSRFPKLGSHLDMRCEVCFNYDTANTISGTVVRDDMEAPFATIIRLDDGRHVLATECQYNIPNESEQC